MNENFCFGTSCSLLILLCIIFFVMSGITKICCNWMYVWFVVDSRQPANNKAGCKGHIHQHSRVMSLVF